MSASDCKHTVGFQVVGVSKSDGKPAVPHVQCMGCNALWLCVPVDMTKPEGIEMVRDAFIEGRDRDALTILQTMGYRKDGPAQAVAAPPDVEAETLHGLRRELEYLGMTGMSQDNEANRQVFDRMNYLKRRISELTYASH